MCVYYCILFFGEVDCCNIVAVSDFFLLGLQNDHKKVMAEIEKKLHQLHKEAREQRLTSQTSQPDAEAQPLQRVSNEMGFARVSVVSSGSPAATAVSGPLIPALPP